MRKNAFVAAAITLLASSLWGLWSLFGFLGQNRAAIAKAQAESAGLATSRDSLVHVIEARERVVRSLGLHNDSLESLARWWRDSANTLERDRAAAQLAVRETDSIAALKAELRANYPELNDSTLRLVQLPIAKGDTLGIQYLMIPAWFAETFVIDHQNAESWRNQRDRLAAADSLELLVTTLGDSIARLEQANAESYDSGYQAAYALYQSLSNKYVAELKKPRFKIGSTVGFVLGAGAGWIVGQTIR